MRFTIRLLLIFFIVFTVQSGNVDYTDDEWGHHHGRFEHGPHHSGEIIADFDDNQAATNESEEIAPEPENVTVSI
ncbi:unnamed protein product [Cylicocyclus nassatus]|uniref:Secreted protein n=1 Tax=Cylicocyclus nassatus TaxID=53992 RepID=A0AA36H3C2_CYLNA|nr:unnamed protein product [Cylicocyclus nassatus]